MDIPEFYSLFLSEVRDHFSEHTQSLESAFADYAITELETAGETEEPVTAFYRGGPPTRTKECAGFAVSEDSDELDLFVIHFDNRDTLYPLHNREVELAFAKLDRFLISALDGLADQLDESTEEEEMCRVIAACAGTLRKVRYILLTNGEIKARKSLHGEVIKHAIISNCSVQYICWDIERFRRNRESGHSNLLEICFDESAEGLPSLWATDSESEYQGCVTVLPGEKLARIYELYGSRLLELNVRSYLQAKGKTNKGILSTLKTMPERFFAFNNGITIVAAEVETTTDRGGVRGIRKLTGFQIVNGGQTTASLHRASISNDLRSGLPLVFVQAKIIILGEEHYRDLIPSISRFANSQNKVSDSDLESNEPYNVGVERVSRMEWTLGMSSKWFFERSRGAYQTERNRVGRTTGSQKQFDAEYPKNQRFSKEDLARYLNCWKGLPHVVSLGPQKNFVRFMAEHGRRPAGWKPTKQEYHHMVAVAILFQSVHKLVSKNRSITKIQKQVASYTVACIAEKTGRLLDLAKVWTNQRLGDATLAAADEWAQEIFEEIVAESNHLKKLESEFCKRQECWNFIRKLTLRIPPGLKSDLLAGGRGAINNEDQINIERCLSLTRDEWRRVYDLVRHDASIALVDRAVVRRMEDLAFDNWSVPPLPEDAATVCSILNRLPIESYRSAVT
jgi:hypothetical protein